MKDLLLLKGIPVNGLLMIRLKQFLSGKGYKKKYKGSRIKREQRFRGEGGL